MVYVNKAEPPRTHDLLLLQIECLKSDSRFGGVGRACEVLTRYGVQPRYPNEMEITEDEMLKAIDYARQVRDCAPLKETRMATVENSEYRIK